MTYMLALDQGTTSSRAIVFDRGGAIRAIAQREFEQIFPRPGLVEHDPTAIWETQVGVAEEALKEVGAGPGDVVGLGITNQRETTVVWNRSTGEPICNAIVWQDRRTSAFCDRLKAEGRSAMIREKTGLVIDAYFSASKLAWILENVNGAREQAERGDLAFGTIDSWLVYNLTGGALHLTDATNASRTMLYDIRTGQWDEELLELFRIPRAMLPEVRDSSEIYGEAASSLPLAGIPIAGILGDQQAALAGQFCVEPGMAKNTYGTGCFTLMNTGTEAVTTNKLITTVAWQRGGERHYALEGSVFIGGAVVQWLRDGLGLINESEDVESLAASVKDNGGVYLVPAFAGLGAPHWDQYARGAIVGLTRGATAGHIARAAVESIAFQVADLVETMRAESGSELPALRVDGGAARNDALLQFQADIDQIPVQRPRITETTALGAAYAAALATDYWRGPNDLEEGGEIERTFEPRMSPEMAAERRRLWSRAVERAMGWEEPGKD